MRVGYKTLKTQHCERSEQKIFGLYPLLVTFWGTLGMPTISSIFAEMYVGRNVRRPTYISANILDIVDMPNVPQNVTSGGNKRYMITRSGNAA